MNAQSFYIFSVKDVGAVGELFYEQTPSATLEGLTKEIFGYEYDVARVIRVSLNGPSVDVTELAAESYADLCDDDDFPRWVEAAAPKRCATLRREAMENEMEARAYARDRSLDIYDRNDR